jgi:hypothetical protein
MKINILLLALPSLFYTALGSSHHDFGGGCNSMDSNNKLKCDDNGNSVPFRMMFCYKGGWITAEDCSKSDKYCEPEPKAHCEFHLRS